jgi:hypothetical protein
MEQLMVNNTTVWKREVFPKSWTEATVIPILKPGKDPNQTNSYRPISLTSFVCKTMKKMVNYRLVHGERKKITYRAIWF